MEELVAFDNLYDVIDIKQYFKLKWDGIPYVEKYIDLLVDANIPVLEINACLECIAFSQDRLFLILILGADLAYELCNLENETPYKYGKHSYERGEII